LIRDYLSEVRGHGVSAEEELKTFVQYRNEAAHGSLDNTISVHEILRYADFVSCLCEAIADLAVHTGITRLVDTGQARIVGRVIKTFSGQRFGVQMERIKVSVGDEFYARSDSSCHVVSVQSLAYKSTVLDDYIWVGGKDPICLKLDRNVGKSSEIILLNGPTERDACHTPQMLEAPKLS
jgi:hypothetical protein